MNKCLQILLILCITHAYLYGQNEKIIIYTDDTPHLMPFIEKTLKSLKNQEEVLIFSKVTNLTRVLENEKDEQVQDEVRTILRGGKGTTYNLSAESKKVFESTLKNNDYFLKINILVVNELIEFQFTLYNILKINAKENPDDYFFRIVNDFEEPEKTVNIFVNPKEKDYLVTLENAIKQVFPQSNSLPTPKLYINGTTVDKLYYCTVKDTLRIDASYSFDKQTSRENLNYTWAQFPVNNEANVPDKKVISLNQNQPFQIIRFPENGIYSMGVSVSDGIGYSQFIIIYVVVIESPLIFIPKKYIELYEFKPSRYKSKPLPFSMDVWVNYYSNNELYYYSDLGSMKVDIRRISKTSIISKSNKQLSKVLQKEKGANWDRILHPEVLKIDTVSATREGFALKMTLEPFDTWNDNLYKFRSQVFNNGVASNIEEFKVRYTSLTWGLHIRTFYFGQILSDTLYNPFSNIRALRTSITFSSADNPNAPDKITKTRIYSAHHSVTFSRFITKNIDISISIPIKRLIIKERTSFPQLKSADLGDSTVYFSYEQAWSTILPSVSVGFNLPYSANSHFFEPYRSVDGNRGSGYLRASMTSYFMTIKDINIPNFADFIFLTPAALEVLMPVAQNELNKFNNTMMKPMITIDLEYYNRILRNPTIHLSVGMGITYFNTLFSLNACIGLRYDLI